MGPRASLGGWKISSPPGFDPRPSSPKSVAIPTELPGPLSNTTYGPIIKIIKSKRINKITKKLT